MEEQDLPHGWLGRHILQPQEVQCRGKTTRSCADTGARHQATARHSPAGLPQSDRTKIQLMMKRIKINSPALWFSKGMMEMKCNKTAETCESTCHECLAKDKIENDKIDSIDEDADLFTKTDMENKKIMREEENMNIRSPQY